MYEPMKDDDTQEATTSVEVTTQAPTQVVESKPKQPRAVKKPNRPMEELLKLKPKDMTTEELHALVTFLKEANMGLQNKVQELDTTCQKTFETCRKMDEAFQKMKLEANSKLRLAEDSVRIAYQTIRMMGGQI